MIVDVAGSRPVVGFIGLGDQGLPMATAIAQAGFELHVWARRSVSLKALGDVPHVAETNLEDLASVCDVVGLCVATDEDVLALAQQMKSTLRPGTIVINHGTGTPAGARHLAELLADRGVEVLDAPVSGGRPAAEEHRLTTLVGGPEEALRRAEPVLRSFAAHVINLGGTGAGQFAKLLNNALLMLNQASIADILDLARQAGADPVRLVNALKTGSASSTALTLFGTMITPTTVDHLGTVQALDMDLFDQAMTEASIDATAITARGRSGAHRLHQVIDQLQGGRG